MEMSDFLVEISRDILILILGIYWLGVIVLVFCSDFYVLWSSIRDEEGCCGLLRVVIFTDLSGS